MNGAQKAKANGNGRGNQASRRKSGAATAYAIPGASDSGKRASLAVRGRGNKPDSAKRKREKLAKQLTKRALAGYPPLQQSFKAHLRASRRPFDGEKVLPFHTYNPEPTLIATPGFASCLWTTSIQPGQHVWLAMGSTNNVSVESEFYGRTHSPLCLNAGTGASTTTVNGPLTYIGVHAASLGYAQQGTDADFYTELNSPASSNIAFVPTSAFPVLTSVNTGTVRWVPIVWGIRIRRVSKVVDAAGSWHIVLPPNRTGLGARISDSDIRDIGSYKLCGSEGGEWAVPARPADLVYSKGSYTGAAFQFTDPAFLAHYYNSSDSVEAYEIEMCLKYAVGGKAINAIGSPVDHAPQHANVLEATSAAITNGIIAPHKSDVAADVVHKAMSTGTSVMNAIQKAAKLDFSFADDLTKVGL